MNARLRISLLLACLSALLAQALPAQDSPSLHLELERAYQQWRAAMTARDAQAWASAITRYRQVVTRNLIVSRRQTFPQAVFEVPLDPPDVQGLRLLEAQAVGETAHLLYFGKVNLGGDPGQIPDSVLMLKFFQERGGWKFDSSKLLRLIDQPELQRQLQAGGRPDILDAPEFTPPGKAPAVPALCDPPQHVTGCTLQSFGYETRLRINGFDYPAMQDHAEKLFVIGGLHDGRNELTLTVRPTEVPAGEERLLQVDLFVLGGRAGQDPVRVFHYESREPGLTGPVQLPVVIDAAVLSSGR